MTYETSVWNFDTVPSIMDAASLDFAVDGEGRPLIAFITTNGVFLAKGDAPSVAEERPQLVREPLRLPTIVRGVLTLPRPSALPPHPPTALLDIGGRKVLDLSPGPNDVGRLAPGVYFVRSESDGRAQKVVIER